MPNLRLCLSITSLALCFAGLASCASSDATSPTGQSGSLTVDVTGLPDDAADVLVTGPAGYNSKVYATTTLTGLTPGRYKIYASAVRLRGGIYFPAVAGAFIDVPAGGAPARASVAYGPALGALDLEITGLPPGVLANVLVQGPESFTPSIATGSRQFTGIQAGSYAIATQLVSRGTTTYGDPVATRSIEVPASAVAASVAVRYAAMTGTLAISVSGTPTGAWPRVLVLGPFGDSMTISDTGNTTLTALPLGTYSVFATSIFVGTTEYRPLTPLLYAQLGPDARNVVATVTYANLAASRSLTVVISGLPPQAVAAVRATHLCPYRRGDPQSWRCSYLYFVHPFTETSTWLVPYADRYYISIGDVDFGGRSYQGTSSSTSIQVSGADTVRVQYHPAP